MNAATIHKQSSENRCRNHCGNSPSSIRVYSRRKLLSPRKSSDAGASPAHPTIEGAESDTANHVSQHQPDDSHEDIYEPNNIDDSNTPAFEASVEWNTAPQAFPSRLENKQRDFHSKTISASSVNSYSTLTRDTPISPVWSYRERREWPLDNNNEFHLLQHYIDSLAPWVCIHQRDARPRVLTRESSSTSRIAGDTLQRQLPSWLHLALYL